VARQLRVTKQTVLNWLYAGKISEPPRSKTNYRLWTESRVALLKKLIAEGRLHKRTVLHRKRRLTRGAALSEYASEVAQFLSDARIDADAFVRELQRLRSQAPPARPRKAAAPKKTTRRKKAARPRKRARRD
jgi:DNA-binding transcriptional MerR regulator